MDFNVAEYEKVIVTASDSTLQPTFKNYQVSRFGVASRNTIYSFLKNC